MRPAPPRTRDQRLGSVHDGDLDRGDGHHPAGPLRQAVGRTHVPQGPGQLGRRIGHRPDHLPHRTARLSIGSDALLLELTSEPQDLERWEGVVGTHLVRFGTREELVVAWRRGDGTAGTVHSKSED